MTPRLPPWLRLLRPGNVLLAAAGALAGILLARTGPVPAATWLAVPVAAGLVAAFGNIANDRNDVALDRRAHPDRPLPSGQMSDRQARTAQWACAGLGLAAAAVPGPATLLLAAGNVLLLLLYEADLKRRGLAGNLAVAWLVASTFLFGAAAVAAPAGWTMALLLAGMAFLVNAARELLKDLQDRDADAGHRLTLPMRLAPPIVRLIAFALVAAAVALSLGPILRPPAGWDVRWLGLLAPADGILLLGAMAARRSVTHAQRLLKGGMAVALLAFVGAAWNAAAGATA